MDVSQATAVMVPGNAAVSAAPELGFDAQPTPVPTNFGLDPTLAEDTARFEE